MTGRIRFKGQANQEYSIESNWQICSNYDITSNVFKKTSINIKGTLNKDGYSDYVYCLPLESEDAGEESIEIIVNYKESNTSFSRTLIPDVLAAGKSGYLDIPNLENPRGWTILKFKDYTVSGVTFRMMRVLTETTNMPKNYYIGETEVTEALYYAIMSGTTSNPQYPMRNLSYSDFQSFITKLNEKTGGNFRLPSDTEWQFAAKGGHLSKGYTYSGSNTADDVAWYSGNSGGTVHNVKTKLPNEIGIYDMSGNVEEWTHYNGNYCYGGTYNYGESGVRSSSYNYGNTYAASYRGIRLACD